MAVSNYQMVLALELLHSYYPNGICTDLQIVPSSATAAVFKRYGFTTVTSSNNVILYSNTVGNLADFLSYIATATGQDSFVFDLKIRTNDFINFTDLPFSGEMGFYFNSSNPSNSLLANNSVQLQCTFAAQPQLGVQGRVQLLFTDVVSMLADGQVNYRIQFSARATQWQYYVVNKSGINLTGPTIKGKQAVTFTDAQPITLATGDTALFFSSADTLLPLSLVPQYRFDLLDKGQGGLKAKVIVKGLPNPAIDFLEKVSINGKSEAASPMYVYI